MVVRPECTEHHGCKWHFCTDSYEYNFKKQRYHYEISHHVTQNDATEKKIHVDILFLRINDLSMLYVVLWDKLRIQVHVCICTCNKFLHTVRGVLM
jgi:hypothetical protein